MNVWGVHNNALTNELTDEGFWWCRAGQRTSQSA